MSYSFKLAFHNRLFSFNKGIEAFRVQSFLVVYYFLNPYLFLIHLTAIRQSMAICIFVIFISLFLIHRRYLFIVLAVALPMLFHEASILYLSVIPILVFVERIYSAKWHHKIFYSALALYLLSSVFAIGLPDTFIKYDVYVERSLGSSISLSTLMYFVLVSFFFFTSKPHMVFDSDSGKIYKTLNVLVFVSLILSAFSLFFPHFSRVLLYFLTFLFHFILPAQGF